jgi:hypothetical protein
MKGCVDTHNDDNLNLIEVDTWRQPTFPLHNSYMLSNAR